MSDLAGLVLANHVVAAAVLLNGGAALGALLGVSGDPVARLAVVIALLDPFLDQVTPDWVMPVFTAVEAEAVTAPALDRLGVHMLRQENYFRDKCIFLERFATSMPSITFLTNNGSPVPSIRPMLTSILLGCD